MRAVVVQRRRGYGSEARRERIQFLATVDERRGIEREAARRGVSVSELVSTLVLAGLGGGVG